MKKPISKIQTRSYCWLPLIVMCVVLPARADQMSFKTSSSGSSGNLTLSGFDASLGTLTGVTVSVDFLDVIFFNSNDAKAVGTVDGVASFAGQLDLPDSTSLGLGANESLDVFIDAGDSASVDPEDQFSRTFTDPSALSTYTASKVEFTYGSTLSFTGTVPAGIERVNSAKVDLGVTYDYTPAVSAVPEPAAVLLLRTMAAACLWASRKRRARAR